MVDRTKFSRLAIWLALAAALLGAVVLPSLAADAPPRALLTIADGPVELLRGAARYRVAEGLALTDGDIVRTDSGTRVARIEFADGRTLDLGPGTQALLPSDPVAAANGLSGAAALVIQGWAKLGVPAAVNASVTPGARLAGPGAIVVVPPAGQLLLHVTPAGGALVFAESRGATLWRRSAPGAAPATIEATLREGEAWSRPAGSPTGSVSVGASMPALQVVPRALADRLPHRAALFAGRNVEPAGGEALEPGDLAPWLRAEAALITALRPRLAALSRELTATRPSIAPRKTALTASAPSASSTRRVASQSSTTEAPRGQRTVAGLTMRPAAAAPGPTPSIALDPTPLLATERAQAMLPAVALATQADPPKRR